MAINYALILLLKPAGLSPWGSWWGALSWSGNHTYHFSLVTSHLEKLLHS